jgi:lysyl-tRNA synthetase class 2
MPDKSHGMTDMLRGKNRALDLISNDNSYQFFSLLSEAIRTIRNLLSQAGFNEFPTGLLQSNFGGGLASAFVTKCNANGRQYALSLTSELKLKKLIAGGFNRVYEITQSFRNEGIDGEHFPEFTALEAYLVGDSLDQLYQFLEEIFRKLLATDTSGTLRNVVDSDNVQLNHLTFVEAMDIACSVRNPTLSSLVSSNSELFDEEMHGFTWVYKCITKIIAPHFIVPTLISEVPHEFNPFCKIVENSTQQSVLVAGGLHIATLSVDEHDLEKVLPQLTNQAEETGISINQELLELYKIGLPPITGIGVGINRLAMLFLPLEKRRIRNSILFPFV